MAIKRTCSEMGDLDTQGPCGPPIKGTPPEAQKYQQLSQNEISLPQNEWARSLSLSERVGHRQGQTFMHRGNSTRIR